MKREDIKEGTIIVNENGEKKVLGICGQIYFLSEHRSFQEPDVVHYVFNDIVGAGFTIKPLTPFKKGDEVAVSSHDEGPWFKRIYSHFEDGMHICFQDGECEWTAEIGYTTEWTRCQSRADYERENR